MILIAIQNRQNTSDDKGYLLCYVCSIIFTFHKISAAAASHIQLPIIPSTTFSPTPTSPPAAPRTLYSLSQLQKLQLFNQTQYSYY